MRQRDYTSTEQLLTEMFASSSQTTKQGGKKIPIGLQITQQQQDMHTMLSRLLLKSEKSPDSLERMLAVTRMVLTFLSQIAKPGKRFQDVPSVVLGEHYLSHRELPGELYRGDHTRTYLQELCAYDPVEAPVGAHVYEKEGHADIGTWLTNIVPKAQVRVKKEGGIIGGSGGMAYVVIALEGHGKVYYQRHDEEYVFNFPSILLCDPLSEKCPIDLEGVVDISCDATGLQTELRFKPWREEYVKGEVKTLLGDGMHTLARIDGHWDTEVSVHSATTDANGVLFSTSDDPPLMTVPPVINLADPGPQTMRRLWSAMIESLLYCECPSATGSVAKKAQELSSSFPSHLKKSLLYVVPENPQGRSALAAGGDVNDPTSQIAAVLDKRPLPPVCKIQRAMGRYLTYQLMYRLQSVSFQALEQEEAEYPQRTK